MLHHRLLKRHLVRICHLLVEKDYVSAMDGNVSARLDDGSFLCTPTMIHKGFITEEDLIVVDEQGTKRSGPAHRRPTSEIQMHLACYRARPDVMAVVHAHPPTAIAFTIAGETLARCVLPEVVLTLGTIPTAPYETTGTSELARLIGELIRTHDAAILDRHGVISVGCDLIDAYGKMEKVEHTALITHKARSLGRVQSLPGAEVEKLRELGRRYTASGHRPPPCEGCSGCPGGIPWQEEPSFTVARARSSEGARTAAVGREREKQPGGAGPGLPSLAQVVTEEVLRVLSDRERSAMT